MTASEEAFLQSRGLLPLITRATAADLSWQDQLGSRSCDCRAGLSQLIPSAKAALQGRRLDEVFRVTGEVVQQCQSVVNCSRCAVNCTDLICVVAVFQEADRCFDYLAKGNIDSAISVSIGSYETTVDKGDATPWRRMLVMQLVKKANELLDSISARGQDMLRELVPECILGRVNIEYLVSNSQGSYSPFGARIPSPPCFAHYLKGYLLTLI